MLDSFSIAAISVLVVLLLANIPRSPLKPFVPDFNIIDDTPRYDKLAEVEARATEAGYNFRAVVLDKPAGEDAPYLAVQLGSKDRFVEDYQKLQSVTGDAQGTVLTNERDRFGPGNLKKNRPSIITKEQRL